MEFFLCFDKNLCTRFISAFECEKTMLLFIMCVNPNLRLHFRAKTNWESIMQMRYSLEYRIRLEYHNCWLSDSLRSDRYYIDAPSWFIAFYRVTRERHECEFGMPERGSCDSPEQLARRFPRFKGTVGLQLEERCSDRIRKKSGFRWRKFGEYVGEMLSKDVTDWKYINECDGRKGRPLVDETWSFVRCINERYGNSYWIENGEAILGTRKEEMRDRLNLFI